jgi:GntR family transcriptional regulator of arabinose operon
MIDLEKIKIDKNSNVPAHKHIVSYIKSKIESEVLKPGDRLPTTRDFIKKAGIGSKTIGEAIEILRKEGLIETSRRGTFVKNIKKVQLETIKSPRKIALFLVPDITSYQYSLLASGLNNTYNSLNVEFVLKNIDSENNNSSFDSCIVEALCNKYSGIIMVPPVPSQLSPNRVHLLQNNKIPVIFCHRRIIGTSGPLVTWRWEDVGKMVANIFMERNHKKIAYLAAAEYEISKSYEKGLRDALMENSIELMDTHVFYGATAHRTVHTEKEKIHFITDILSSPERPSAIFCNDASSELLVFMIAENMNIKIPEELSLLRFGDYPHSYPKSNLISNVFVDHKKIGEIARDLLIEVQNDSRVIDSDEIIYVPIGFNPGKTLSHCRH